MVPRLHRPEGDMSAPLSLSLSLALVKPKASLASEKQGGPPSLTQVWLPHKAGRQELPPCLILTPPPGKHKRNASPRMLSPQQHRYQPIRQSHLFYPPKFSSSSPLSSRWGRGGSGSQSQTFTVHTCLPQTV